MKNTELLGLSTVKTNDLNIILNKFRGLVGVEIKIINVKNKTVQISVKQIAMENGWILNRKELIERAEEILRDLRENFHIQYKVSVYESNFKDITKDWIRSKMKEFEVNQVDICANLSLDKATLSDILGNKKRILTRFQKSTFYFYFVNFELNKKFREYINILQKEIEKN